MWSQSVNVFDPYAALMDASAKSNSTDEKKTTEDEK